MYCSAFSLLLVLEEAALEFSGLASWGWVLGQSNKATTVARKFRRGRMLGSTGCEHGVFERGSEAERDIIEDLQVVYLVFWLV